jgi:YD repeat-containing protein
MQDGIVNLSSKLKHWSHEERPVPLLRLSFPPTNATGSSYTYAYDSMGRMNKMTDTVNSRTLISGMTYGVANNVQQMTSGHTNGVDSCRCEFR